MVKEGALELIFPANSEAHIIRGTHTTHFRSNLDLLDNALDKRLNTQDDRKVFVLVENAECVDVMADFAHSIVRDYSVSPAQAYLATIGVQAVSEIPPLNEAVKIISGWGIEKFKPEPFHYKNFKIIDKYFSKFPNRLGMVLEGSPLSEIEEYKREDPFIHYQKCCLEITRSIRQRSPANIIKSYRSATLEVAEYIKSRDMRFITRLAKYAAEEGVSSFIGYFGGLHIITDLLRSCGVLVTEEIPEQVNPKSNINDPEVMLIRKTAIYGIESVSDQELTRTLISLLR